MPEPRRVRMTYVLVALVLLGVITAARFAVTNGADGVGFLFVLPVAILGAELRWPGAVAGSAASVGLTAAWAGTQGVPVSPLGYVVRAVSLLAVGLGVHVLLEQRDRLAGEVAEEREKLLAHARQLADTDELTGLASRRAWYGRLGLELTRARRSGEPVAVVVLDLDDFKSVNDTLGHRTGDALLESCAKAWHETVRAVDLIGRLGGDEFAVVMPACDAAGAEEAVTRLRAATPGRATCSAGCAIWDGLESDDALVDRADRCLYAAKAARAAALATVR